jgi:hypothetical protein
LFGVGFGLANGVIDVPRALFYLSFISMQLVEYFAWKNMSDTEIPSKVGLFIIFLQIPLMINMYYRDKPYVNLLYAMYFTFTAFIFFTTQVKYSMHKAPNGHLSWDWLNSFSKVHLVTFILFYVVLALYRPDVNTSLFLIVSIAFSWYTYYSSGTFGSMWCWFANILSLHWILQVFMKELC